MSKYQLLCVCLGPAGYI